MNDENLKPFQTYAESVQREIRSKGGFARAKKIAARKSSAEIARALGDLAVKNPKLLSSLHDLGIKKEDADNRTAFIARLYAEAIKGNVRAAHELLDLMGEMNNYTVKADVLTNAPTLSRSEAVVMMYGDFSQKYRDFFARTAAERVVMLQGGRRSGKTQATFRHLLHLGRVMGGTHRVTVLCSQYTMLVSTMRDFTKVTGITPHAEQAETPGLKWDFIHRDEGEKAQGTDCDFLFINEAVNLNEAVWETIRTSPREQIFMNYNPTKSGWVNRLIKPDESNMLKTTWQDNDYLSAEQREEFEEIKRRALSPTATLRDKYTYEVYYLGNFSSMAGCVFADVRGCSLEDYRAVECEEFFGMDFGFTIGGDPTTLVGIKTQGGALYVHEYIYDRGLTNDAELVRKMLEAGLTERTEVWADYGGMGTERITKINSGCGVAKYMNVRRCVKPMKGTSGEGHVQNNLMDMAEFSPIYVTECSLASRKEFEEYECDQEKGRMVGDDHAIDAARYAFNAAVLKRWRK